MQAHLMFELMRQLMQSHLRDQLRRNIMGESLYTNHEVMLRGKDGSGSVLTLWTRNRDTESERAWRAVARFAEASEGTE
jgi:hypothetical protein